jgi:uncharacterized protein YndB with AHSA1/START domain
MPHEFEVRKEVELDATPEEVWDLIATGPGIDSWFMGRNEVEPRVGGIARMDVGGFGQDATVTAWEPGRRFATRGEEAPDGTVHAFEYLIEGREGGSTVLRLVHSGFLGSETWEAEMSGMEIGWNMYLDKMREYFEYFRGRVARGVFAAAEPKEADKDRIMPMLRGALGIGDGAAVGDAVTITPEGMPPIDGTVDYLSPDFLGVRTDDATYRFIRGWNDTAVLGHNLFADDVDEQEAEKSWQNWLSGVFA